MVPSIQRNDTWVILLYPSTRIEPMKPSNRRRVPFPLIALLVVLCGLPARCLALDVLKELSKEEAKKLGIMVETKPRAEAHDVWVQVDFRLVMPNKQPKYVNLDVTPRGKRLVYVALMPEHPSPGTTHFDFYIAPAALPDASIVVTEVGAPVPNHGYVLRLKDYLQMAAPR